MSAEIPRKLILTLVGTNKITLKQDEARPLDCRYPNLCPTVDPRASRNWTEEPPAPHRWHQRPAKLMTILQMERISERTRTRSMPMDWPIHWSRSTTFAIKIDLSGCVSIVVTVGL